MRTIYLDVLIVCSLYMNYLLLRLTARMTHTRLRFGRAMLGAGLGSLGSLAVLLPKLPFLLSLLMKTGMAAGMCAAAFGWRSRRRFFWHLLVFLGAGCIMAGILLALTATGRVWYVNGYWYPDITLPSLAVCTIAAYLVLMLVQRLHDRSHADSGAYRVLIRLGGRTTGLEGLADTGNSLVDFFTGLPVIICDRKRLADILPDTLPPEKFRPLPYTTVAGTWLLTVFRPDEVLICSDREERSRQVDALIGLGEQENGRAIFNPKLLRY